MKQFKDFIIEKFKINSKSISKNEQKEIEIKFDKSKVEFPDGDLDKIIEFAEELPIVPDILEYFDNSTALRLSYKFKDSQKLHYGIVLSYLNSGKTQGYRISFVTDQRNGLNDEIEEYPDFPKIITLKEAFDYIDKKFNEWIK